MTADPPSISPYDVGRRLRFGDRAVKSAVRVLQIVELFDTIKREATAREVALGLGLPQSSTLSLLQTMTDLGYLDYDRHAKTYHPSERVGMMGSWVDPHFVAAGPVLGLMKALCARLGQNVVLVTPNGAFAQTIHAEQPPDAADPQVVVGSGRPLLTSATGQSLLIQMPDEEIGRRVWRHNAEAPEGAPRVDLAAMRETVRIARRDGYAFVAHATLFEGWVIAIPLPDIRRKHLYAIGIGAFTDASLMPDAVFREARPIIRRWLPQMDKEDGGIDAI